MSPALIDSLKSQFTSRQHTELVWPRKMLHLRSLLIELFLIISSRMPDSKRHQRMVLSREALNACELPQSTRTTSLDFKHLTQRPAATQLLWPFSTLSCCPVVKSHSTRRPPMVPSSARPLFQSTTTASLQLMPGRSTSSSLPYVKLHVSM